MYLSQLYYPVLPQWFNLFITILFSIAVVIFILKIDCAGLWYYLIRFFGVFIIGISFVVLRFINKEEINLKSNRLKGVFTPANS